MPKIDLYNDEKFMLIDLIDEDSFPSHMVVFGAFMREIKDAESESDHNRAERLVAQNGDGHLVKGNLGK